MMGSSVSAGSGIWPGHLTSPTFRIYVATVPIRPLNRVRSIRFTFMPLWRLLNVSVELGAELHTISWVRPYDYGKTGAVELWLWWCYFVLVRIWSAQVLVQGIRH